MKKPTSSLLNELKQKKPFASPRQEGVAALLRTTDLLHRHISRVVEPRDLTLQQYNVLRILRGSEPEGLPTLEIAERMIERSPGITRLLDRIEAKALVTRERGKRDRRQVLCRITPKGLTLLAELDAPVHEAGEKFLAALPNRSVQLLLEILEEVRASQS
jgi:DNA-binding MarR family transcriptional regulator